MSCLDRPAPRSCVARSPARQHHIGAVRPDIQAGRPRRALERQDPRQQSGRHRLNRNRNGTTDEEDHGRSRGVRRSGPLVDELLIPAARPGGARAWQDRPRGGRYIAALSDTPGSPVTRSSSPRASTCGPKARPAPTRSRSTSAVIRRGRPAHHFEDGVARRRTLQPAESRCVFDVDGTTGNGNDFNILVGEPVYGVDGSGNDDRLVADQRIQRSRQGCGSADHRRLRFGLARVAGTVEDGDPRGQDVRRSGSPSARA